MATRDRASIPDLTAAARERAERLGELEQHVAGLTNIISNLIDRVGLLEHAMSKLIEDVYYSDEPPTEASMMDDVRDNAFDDEETVEEEAARLRAEALEQAEADFSFEGNPHGD